MRGSLAVRLQTLRASQGLTLTEASEQLGINRHTLSRLEAGTQRPYGPTLKKLAKGYGVDVGDLIEEPVLSEKAEAPKVEASSPPPEATASLAEEERRSAELAKKNLEQNKRAIWQEGQVEEFLYLSRRHLETMETLMKEEDPSTAMVEELAGTADYLVAKGTGLPMHLNLDDRASEECDALAAELLHATMRMIKAQEAREKDRDKRGVLIQLHQQVAGRRAS